MAKRLLPFRDYSEHEVFNMAALTTAGATLTDWRPDKALNTAFVALGNLWDSGVVVSIDSTKAALPGDNHTQDSTYSSDDLRGYLGAEHAQASTHVGFVAYPEVPMKLKAHAGDSVGAVGSENVEPAIGLTLKETLAYDENMEKMLYYPQKLDECQGVLPGQG